MMAKKRLDASLFYKIALYNLCIARTYKCFVTHYLRYIEEDSNVEDHGTAMQLDMQDKDGDLDTWAIS